MAAICVFRIAFLRRVTRLDLYAYYENLLYVYICALVLARSDGMCRGWPAKREDKAVIDLPGGKANRSRRGRIYCHVRIQLLSSSSVLNWSIMQIRFC